MVWWIVGGVLAAALVGVVAAVAATLGSLRRLAAVVRTLQRRASEAEALAERMTALAEHSMRLQPSVLLAERRADALRARLQRGSSA